MAITNATTLADYAAGISTQNATLKVDSGNKRVGIGTTNPKQTLQVGTAVSVYGTTGIVSATSFYGDGANLTNVGVDTATVNTDQLNVIGVTTVGSAVTINSTGIDAVSGVITASSFVGNVTGNASGTAGGLTGTPDIAVRNITGVAATFTGVLTYEDVTNVDSVGIVTARGGLEVGAAGVGGTISSGGNVIFAGITTIGTGLSFADNIEAKFGNSGDLRIYHDASNSYIEQSGTGNLVIKDNTGSGGVRIFSNDLVIKNQADSQDIAKFAEGGAVELYFNNSKKLETHNTGVKVTGVSTVTGDSFVGSAITMYASAGIVSATKFTGDGSLLTNLPAGGGLTEIDAWTLSGSWPNMPTGTWSNARLGDNANTTGTGILVRNSENNMPVGTGMTHTDGLFTFPSAGTWQIDINLYLERKDASNCNGLRVGLSGAVDGTGVSLITTEQDINSYVTHSGINLTGIMKFTNTGTSNFYVKLNGSGDVYIKALSASQNIIFKKLA